MCRADIAFAAAAHCAQLRPHRRLRGVRNGDGRRPHSRWQLARGAAGGALTATRGPGPAPGCGALPPVRPAHLVHLRDGQTQQRGAASAAGAGARVAAARALAAAGAMAAGAMAAAALDHGARFGGSWRRSSILNVMWRRAPFAPSAPSPRPGGGTGGGCAGYMQRIRNETLRPRTWRFEEPANCLAPAECQRQAAAG